MKVAERSLEIWTLLDLLGAERTSRDAQALSPAYDGGRGGLAKFEPPPEIYHLIHFADANQVGQEAGERLRQLVDGRVKDERRTPPAPAKDWADVLASRST